MSDVKLYQKAKLELGALDVVYASRADGSADGKATLSAVADIAHGVNGHLYAEAAHGHEAADVSDFDAAADTRIAAAVGVSVQAFSANLAEYAAVNPSAAGLALVDGADAANLTGTVSVNRFNGGAGASSATFLRGDGTWATPMGAAFRGALVKKSADQTGADYSASPAISWDGEAYDTDSFHDSVANPSRLTVPSGVSYVRLTGVVRLANVTSGVVVALFFQKNGSLTYHGSTTQQTQITGSTPALQFSSPVLAVAPGDYFEMHMGCSDTSIDITAARSHFSIEAVA